MNKGETLKVCSLTELEEMLFSLEKKRVVLKANLKSLNRVKFNTQMIEDCEQRLERTEENIISLKETIDTIRSS